MKNKYNSITGYLTKNGKTSISGGPVLNQKPIGTRTALSRGGSDAQVMPKKSKMEEYINDHLIVYENKKATAAETKAALNRIESYPKKMSKKDEYNRYFNKKSDGYYNKKKPTSPVKIDFDLTPTFKPERTAFIGLWPTVKDSSVFKLLENPRAAGTELSYEGIMEIYNLMQKSGLLKNGGRV